MVGSSRIDYGSFFSVRERQRFSSTERAYNIKVCLTLSEILMGILDPHSQ